ncbi:hypothetical protein OU798_12375 [Prolixibacteraceae bacterium Z1-6]|uniref:Uncharacterized protein n=1 Tax=Draconibacterium aestuarii TaxID=2998507 RepID=A0A9X3FDS5_9BACT|nr:hypothetical protein [Prolixibacteraceae bacterium Z1-6]
MEKKRNTIIHVFSFDRKTQFERMDAFSLWNYSNTKIVLVEVLSLYNSKKLKAQSGRTQGGSAWLCHPGDQKEERFVASEQIVTDSSLAFGMTGLEEKRRREGEKETWRRK